MYQLTTGSCQQDEDVAPAADDDGDGWSITADGFSCAEMLQMWSYHG